MNEIVLLHYLNIVFVAVKPTADKIFVMGDFNDRYNGLGR
jgi:hypothetical protein